MMIINSKESCMALGIALFLSLLLSELSLVLSLVLIVSELRRITNSNPVYANINMNAPAKIFGISFGDNLNRF